MDLKATRNGATGALLDEYERAIAELISLINKIPDDRLVIITDHDTADENCRSVQTILSHVVHAGFGYATAIYNSKGHTAARPGKTFHTTVGEYSRDLNDMFAYTGQVFKDIGNDELEEFNDSLKIRSSWGQTYDIEQLMEHAIVHILRHRRQVERMDIAGMKR
jgi:uncharacterized damage-inducible protein DinB